MSFTVSTDRLEELGHTMRSLATRCGQVAERRVPYDGCADAAPVDAGLHEFFGRWTDGMARLHDELIGLAEALEGAVAGYEGGERAICSAAHPRGSR